MFKIPAQQALKFLKETNKYTALSNLCDYLNDICIEDKQSDTVCIREATNAAMALKFAMENDKEGIATAHFNEQFKQLWNFIVQYCESCSTISWIVEITEVSQKHVIIDAYSKEDALTLARDMYNNEIIVLDATNHIETKFEIVEEQ